MLHAVDSALINAVGWVVVDLLKRASFDVEDRISGWATSAQRRTSKEPVERGGWSLAKPTSSTSFSSRLAIAAVEWSKKMADLDQELEGLRAAAGRHAARYQVIEDCRWPAGARIAVNVTADFDAMLLRRLLNEPALQLAKGEFGGRVGIWRLLELFASHDIKATIFTPGRICELYPDAVRASAAGGHEVADHMWEHRVPAERALEEDHLKRALDALEKLAGKRPVGSRSGHTLSVLRAEGIIYHSHRVQDHRPHWVRDTSGEERMLNLPFHYSIDDAMYYSFAWLNTENAAQRITDPERVEEMWWDAFRQQYEVGGYLNICLHPFVSGRAQRIAMMDRLFTRMKRLPGVWFPTCETVARHLIAATTQAA